MMYCTCYQHKCRYDTQGPDYIKIKIRFNLTRNDDHLTAGIDSIVKYTIYVAGHTYTEVHKIKIISNLNNSPRYDDHFIGHTYT